MSPRCRRSARIASISSKKQRDSPAPHELASLSEVNESSELAKNNSPARVVDNTMPSSTSTPVTPSARSKKQKLIASDVADALSSPSANPVTPSTAAPVKLPISEMHPSKAHQTMAPPSSGLRNGFVDIDYNNTPRRSLIQNTPSKTPVPSSEFTFRYARPNAYTGLGPEALKLMNELRDDVARNKEELIAERARDAAKQAESGDGRQIAAAKGKKSRFSAAHTAEFQKMHSIAGHASGFRAAPTRSTATAATSAKPVTPVKAGIKRSQSNANLDEADSAQSKAVAPRSLAKSTNKNRDTAEPSSKRARKNMEDDVSAVRPASRDETQMPRPNNNSNNPRSGIPQSKSLGSLMTPTKSSLARTNSVKTPTTALGRSPTQSELQKVNSFSAKVGNSLLRSPSKIDLETLSRSTEKKGFGFRGWGTKNKSGTPSSVPPQVATPSRFDSIKSILKRQPGTAKAKSSIPLFSSAAKTPERQGVTDKMFPAVPQTTPGRKQIRHVDFTSDTKQPVIEQNSPSSVKPSNTKPVSFPKLPPPRFVAGGKGTSSALSTGQVTYPDLSAYEVDGDKPEPQNESVPGTFSFRSDHTIRFEDSPTKGFGSASGQASLRKVRESIAPSVSLPGAFPSGSEASPNKENTDPLVRNGIPHGITSKKRQRAEREETEEDEGAKRGMKKSRKNPSPAVGRAPAAPKRPTLSSSPKKAARSKMPPPSPQKKKSGLSMSRLQMLAQPKNRK